MFDYEFWTKHINTRVWEVGGEGATVLLKRASGDVRYVQRIIHTSRSGYVSLSVYEPHSAKPILSSTSQTMTLDTQSGTTMSLNVVFDTIDDVEIRRVGAQTKHLRFEEK